MIIFHNRLYLNLYNYAPPERLLGFATKKQGCNKYSYTQALTCSYFVSEKIHSQKQNVEGQGVRFKLLLILPCSFPKRLAVAIKSSTVRQI